METLLSAANQVPLHKCSLTSILVPRKVSLLLLTLIFDGRDNTRDTIVSDY